LRNLWKDFIRNIGKVTSNRINLTMRCCSVDGGPFGVQVGATAWRRKSGEISGQADTMRMVRLLEHALFSVLAQCRTSRV